jgi:outer membrane protein assembly factor BamB
MPHNPLNSFNLHRLGQLGTALLACILSCGNLLTPSATLAADWPCWRGPAHNSITPEPIRLDWNTRPPQPVWTAQVGIGFSSCVVVGQQLVTMGHREEHDVITCLNTANGQELWSYRYPAPLDPNLFEGGPTATPTVHQQRVYTLSRRGVACCLDLASGELLWQKQLQQETGANLPEWGFSGSPLALEAGILLNMGSHGLLLNPADGSIRWKSDNSDDAGYSTPVLLSRNADALVLLMSAKAANAVQPTSGELVWKFDWITRYGVNAADPQITPQGILLSSGYSKGSTLLQVGAAGNSPEAVWRSRDLRNQMSPGVVLNGHLYAIDGDAGSATSLRCLRVEDGQLAWSHEGLGAGTLIATRQHLLILGERGLLVLAAASPEKFASLGELQVLEGKCWTLPALAHGRLYCRNAAGKLVCLDLSP